jgi:hypothetical protein
MTAASGTAALRCPQADSCAGPSGRNCKARHSSANRWHLKNCNFGCPALASSVIFSLHRDRVVRAGWLMSWSVEKSGIETITRMRKRVTDGLKTTFATRYGAEISLRQMLHPEMVKRYTKTGTGEKFLVKMDN